MPGDRVIAPHLTADLPLADYATLTLYFAEYLTAYGMHR
jgi:hypothetical protein